MANKHSNDKTVTCTVINKDTIRYGGSAFRRERTCRFETFQEPEGGAIWDKCDNCGYQIGWDGQYTPVRTYTFCPGCGALVERSA